MRQAGTAISAENSLTSLTGMSPGIVELGFSDFLIRAYTYHSSKTSFDWLLEELNIFLTLNGNLSTQIGSNS